MVEKVYLVRHGHIDTGGEKRYIGQTNLPLDALGLEQAHALSKYFKTIPLDAVFTSPLMRCVQTTRIIASAYEEVEALREINMGNWENMPLREIRARDPQGFEERGRNIEHFTPPQGESFSTLSKRVLEAFHTLTQNYHGTVLIVAHAGVNRVILRHILGVSFEKIFEIKQPYAGVNLLVRDLKKEEWKEALHVKPL
ncbi:MAG: histidine phosphatase family protein [Campylobacterales bacterium]|nr:histidine phosphatase family protein [Campylobacterales bacterium]